jgi:hypothetical protein
MPIASVGDVPRGALPAALAHRLGDDPHALAVALDPRQEIAPVGAHVLVAAQRHVQRRAILGGVDALAGEQPLDRGGEVALAREGDQEREGFRGDALLGEVEGEAGTTEGEGRAALGVARPQLGEARCGERFAVREEGAPGGRGGERWHFGRASSRSDSTPA